MKKMSILMMVILALAGISSCSAKSMKKGTAMTKTIIAPDSTASAVLGRSLSEILFSPTKVNVYSLKLKDRVDKDDVEVEDHIVRDSLLAVLSGEETAVLQYILLSDGNSYQRDSIIVRSPFTPALEFEFVKKKVTAQVVMSPLDNSWTVWYDGKRQFHFNFADKKGVKRFCRYYLNLKSK
ncbi:MAG: hypothetical protein IJ551_11480 [Prevotella sp.]|nr:hypothetical protein [Prevotella sp.]